MKTLAAAVFLVSTAAPALAQDETVGLRVREWYERMSGTVESSAKGLGSTSIDLANDLGLGDRNWTAEVQAYLHVPLAGYIYAGWWRAHDSGSETLEKQVNFAGETFAASTQIDSEFTLDVGYLTYEFAFPVIPLGNLIKLELGVSVGARVIRGEGRIEDSSMSAHDSGVVGLPTVGAHAALRLFNYVRADVEVLGLLFRYSGNEVHYLEAYAEVTVEPLPWVFAGVGYKLAEVDLQHRGSDSFHINLDLSGVYLTVGLRF